MTRGERKRYPSDLTDQQWEIVSELIPEPRKSRKGGRPRSVHMREVLNTIFYQPSGGLLPSPNGSDDFLLRPIMRLFSLFAPRQTASSPTCRQIAPPPPPRHDKRERLAKADTTRQATPTASVPLGGGIAALVHAMGRILGR